MMSKKDQTIVIGGGPGGASAAIYLANFGHQVLLIDAPKKVHGRTMMAAGIENYLGFPKAILGKDLLKIVERQLKKFFVEKKDEKVLRVSRKGREFLVETDKPSQYQARYLIIAVGLSDKMPEIEDLDQYFDNSLYHCLTCNWFAKRNKKLAFVTDSDAGLKNALATIVRHRPPKLSIIPGSINFHFSPKLVKRVEEEKVKVYKSPIKKLNGRNGFLKSITLADDTLVSAEVIFTKLGQKRFDEFLKEGRIFPKRDDEGFIEVDFQTFETSIPNMFAIGPCNSGTDQIIIAGGEGALAALEIDKRILREQDIKL